MFVSEVQVGLSWLDTACVALRAPELCIRLQVDEQRLVMKHFPVYCIWGEGFAAFVLISRAFLVAENLRSKVGLSSGGSLIELSCYPGRSSHICMHPWEKLLVCELSFNYFKIVSCHCGSYRNRHIIMNSFYKFAHLWCHYFFMCSLSSLVTLFLLGWLFLLKFFS